MQDAIRTPHDDRGRRLDGAGAALGWWTTGNKQAFAAKAQALVEQFKAYNAPEGARGNGQEGTDLVGLRAQEEPSSPGSEPR